MTRVKVWLSEQDIVPHWIKTAKRLYLSAWSDGNSTKPDLYQSIENPNPKKIQKSCEEFLARLKNLNFDPYFWGKDLKSFDLDKSTNKEFRFVQIPQTAKAKDRSRASAFSNLKTQATMSLLTHEFPEFPWDDLKNESKIIDLIKNKILLSLLDLNHPLIQSCYEKSLIKPKMLLHVCCGPDAAGVIEQLKKDYELSCFWYDPNIQPKSEHDLRLEAFKKVAKIEDVPFIEGEYDVDHFLERIKGLEFSPEKGAKCSICYDMRLERSAIEAKDKGFDTFATTLAISPHKVQQKLKAFGALSEKRHGVPYYHRNFLKMDGFKNSVEYTKEHEIYRQDYCGCYFSLYEGGDKAKQMAKDLGYLPPQQA